MRRISCKGISNQWFLILLIAVFLFDGVKGGQTQKCCVKEGMDMLCSSEDTCCECNDCCTSLEFCSPLFSACVSYFMVFAMTVAIIFFFTTCFLNYKQKLHYIKDEQSLLELRRRYSKKQPKSVGSNEKRNSNGDTDEFRMRVFSDEISNNQLLADLSLKGNSPTNFENLQEVGQRIVKENSNQINEELFLETLKDTRGRSDLLETTHKFN